MWEIIALVAFFVLAFAAFLAFVLYDNDYWDESDDWGRS